MSIRFTTSEGEIEVPKRWGERWYTLPWLLSGLQPPTSSTPYIPLFMFVTVEEGIIVSDSNPILMCRVLDYIEKIIEQYVEELGDSLKFDEIFRVDTTIPSCPLPSGEINMIEALGYYNILLAIDDNKKRTDQKEFCECIYITLGRKALEVYMKVAERWCKLLHIHKEAPVLARKFVKEAKKYLEQNE